MHRLSKVMYLILLGFTLTFAFDKQTFDLSENQLLPDEQISSLAKIPAPGVDYLTVSSDLIEATLLKEGFFTMGTVAGLDDGVLDNFQALSYGHPFAMTSFPIITIDGSQYRLDQYFGESGFNFTLPSESEIVLNFNNGIMESQFSIEVPPEDPELIRFTLTLKNIDDQNHVVSTGYLLDPALGSWGDGHLTVNSTPIETVTSFTPGTLTNPLRIDERRNFNTGLRLSINYSDGQIPDQLRIDNWSVLAGHQDSTVSDLYDLALTWQNMITSLAPDSSLTSEFSAKLETPNFPEGPYLRSQLPQMLSLYENLVFPRHLNCFTRISNNAGNNYEDLTLVMRSEGLFDDWTGPLFSVAPNGMAYGDVPLHFPEIFENRVYPLTLEIFQGNELLDVLQQSCFIPASPYSDTGLVVLADSVLFENYPEVSARFNVSNATTGQYVFGLQSENVFLYEDQTRIYDYSLGVDTTDGVNAADIVFVLDVTGSMGGEIDQVKTNLVAFTDTLYNQNVDFRLAMVTFLDEVENIYDFTGDVDLFQAHINEQYAHGGGDWKENSLDAIYAASQLQFRDQASRIFIWITDAGYHVNEGPTTHTVEGIVDALLINGITCHAIAGTEIQVQYCDPITFPTGGNFFNINGNFLDILLEIGDLGGTNNYLIAYDSPNSGTSPRTIMLEVHHAGLGGIGSIQYTPPSTVLSRTSRLNVTCYPNPFNPSITIDFHVPDISTGRISIFNLKGQLIRQFDKLDPGQQKLSWNALDFKGRKVAAGLYFMQISLVDPTGRQYSNELIKLVHAK